MTDFQLPVRAANLSVQVAAQIEGFITSGKWMVGTRIPPESELISQLGVSRNTIREALRSLVHSGLLDARVGDGTYVCSFSELESPLVRRAQRASLREAIEIRGILEQAAARLAAMRRKDSDIAILRTLCNSMRKASDAGDAEACADADDKLHQAILRCTDNELLAELYLHFGGALKISIRPRLWSEAVAREETAHHLALVEAIVSGNPAKAEKAALKIVRILREALLPPSNST